MTYQELYVQHLESALDSGGSQAAIDLVITEFNNPTRAGFTAWSSKLPWAACTTCGDSFKPEAAEPSQEILCPAHVPKIDP